jgi:F-type H+-transporting ATPase subunit delta
MAERTTIARPYADAAFRIASEGNALAKWSGMLRAAATIGADATMAKALGNPKLSAEEKSSLFLSVAGDGFDADMRSFVRVLIDGRRIELLPEIRTLFEAFKADAEGVAKAAIESAQPLSDAEVAGLAAAMSQRLGKRVETTTSVNPALIGGARIAVGDTVIDGSVRGKLEQMRQTLLR